MTEFRKHSLIGVQITVVWLIFYFTFKNHDPLFTELVILSGFLVASFSTYFIVCERKASQNNEYKVPSKWLQLYGMMLPLSFIALPMGAMLLISYFQETGIGRVILITILSYCFLVLWLTNLGFFLVGLVGDYQAILEKILDLEIKKMTKKLQKRFKHIDQSLAQ